MPTLFKVMVGEVDCAINEYHTSYFTADGPPPQDVDPEITVEPTTVPVV
jgi:hypothetical protein